MKRLVITTALGLTLAGAVSASAAPPPPPVSVTVDDRGVCVTVSLQVPQCVPLSLVKRANTKQDLPIGLPYRKGNEICYDPTPTSKGPCVPLD